MSKPAAAANLTEQEPNTLQHRLRAGTTQRRMVERARILLPAHPGRTTARIAGDLRTRPAPVSKWRQRFARRCRRGRFRADPEFAVKAAAVVGLYRNPPENALVPAVEEMPSIQALERNQGWTRLPDGKARTGFSHRSTRHGTTT